MKKFILYITLIFSCSISSQETLKGMIMDNGNPKDKLGIEGVTVFWLNTSIASVTNEKGWFEIPYKLSYKKLVISYLGYKTDTLTITSPKTFHHFLTPESELDEIKINAKKSSSFRNSLTTANVFTVNSEELLKAACCNLAESFETNPSIDVNFSDALTGTRQIQMLGLKSPYLLITQENIPSIRGASQVFGLTFTPGTWVESIQISKGAGTVVNGYESISGQINTELVKPFSDSPFFLNAYGSVNGRLEFNTHINKKLNDKWSTGLYVHGNYRGERFDKNGDNFLDMPLANQINVMNRWQYTNQEKGWVSFINLRYLNDIKQTGEINFDKSIDQGTTNAWGSEIKTNRLDFSAKVGYVFPELPFQSFGFQLAYSNHQQDSYFGLRDYEIGHQSVYSNFIFNSIIGDTRYKFKTGISFTHDSYNELVLINNYNRIENSLGTFFEYAYDNLDNLSFTAGIRVDHHNLLGTFITPRLHLRYIPWEGATVRGSIGRGIRSANIFAENQQLFASSRAINIANSNGAIYGLNPEIAWNYGVSYLQKFNLFGNKADVTFDFYRTDFENQVVVDWENSQQISFYNLDGKSTADSFQLEVNYNLSKGLDFRTAYKYFDVITDYNSGRLQKPLQPRNRWFANLSYETEKSADRQWRFDITFNTIGEQRLPDTNINPVQYRLPSSVDGYSLLNAQISKVFSKRFEVYLGGENLTNRRQLNPILASDAPFGPNFDTTIVYAPIFGRMMYTGLRFRIDELN